MGRAGAWSGNDTHLKPDYNTFENTELIKLNRRMMDDLGYGHNHEHEFSQQTIIDMAQRADSIDLSPYQDFVDRCNEHQPWVWKDPRLTWTIRVWARLIDLSKTSFVVLTRDDDQAWISSTLRRHIQTRAFTNYYNHGIVASLKDFLDSNDCAFVEYQFEDLLLTPERTIESLNSYLGSALTMDDVKAVHRAPLYRKSRNWKDKLLAYAIFFKNIREAQRL